MVDSTRRKLLKLLGATGAATTVGGAGVAAAHDDDDAKSKINDAMDEVEDGIESARVRVGHLSPDASAIDVYAYIPGYKSIGQVPVETGLSYPTVRPDLPANYTNVPAMPLGIRVTPAGEKDETLLEISRVELEADRNYTFLAVGEAEPELSQPELQVLTLVDNESEVPPKDGATMLPELDETLVRVVHAESEAESVTVHSGAERLTSVGFGRTTGYRSVDSDDDLTITGHRRSGSGSEGESLETITGGLRRGHAYTVYVVEDQPEVSDFKPTVTVTVDACARPKLETDD
jgi:hypothetical protein